MPFCERGRSLGNVCVIRRGYRKPVSLQSRHLQRLRPVSPRGIETVSNETTVAPAGAGKGAGDDRSYRLRICARPAAVWPKHWSSRSGTATPFDPRSRSNASSASRARAACFLALAQPGSTLPVRVPRGGMRKLAAV